MTTKYDIVELKETETRFDKVTRRWMPNNETRPEFVVHTVSNGNGSNNYYRYDNKIEADKMYNKKVKSLIK